MEYISFDEAKKLAQAEVEHVLSTSPLIIRGYTKHLMMSKGKFIRAYAVLLCAEEKDGGIHPDAAKIAAAIEIVHLATLVHDDVMDDADLRRGQATLQKKYGKRTAVICGDYLLCAALKLSASVTDKDGYSGINMPDYMSRVCLGELNQHINNDNYDLSIYQYLKIISGKTAALFEASFYAGALFRKDKEKDLNRYRQLGYCIGMIFQLTDDCIDFETTVEEAKKPVQSDFEQGVITLPLIHAFRNKEGLREKARAGVLSRDEINAAVTETGGLPFSKQVVTKYYKKFRNTLDYMDLGETKKERLLLLLDKAARK